MIAQGWPAIGNPALQKVVRRNSIYQTDVARII